MRITSRDRRRSSVARWIVCALVAAGVAGSITLVAQRAGGAPAKAPAQTPAKAPSKAPAKANPPAPAMPPPQISVVGVRVVGGGLGANGSELHAFNEHPGTAVALAIQAPAGAGIVEIDDDGSRVDAFSDDKGRNLLEEGRFGPFPKVSEDRTAGLVDVEVRGRPSAGAAALTVQGSVAMTLAGGSKPTRIPNVRLEPARTMKLGAATITVKSVTPSDDSTDITLALSRAVMNTISAIRFFDAKGDVLESRRTGSGYMNDAAELELRLKSLEKVVSIEFDVWQNMRQIKAPFNVSTGLSVAGSDNRPAAAAGPTSPAASDAAGAARPAQSRSNVPAIAPGPNDGAASVEAVVSQLQTAAAAGKARELLAVIFPDDRATFGQGTAMMLTLSMLGNMNDQKAAEKAQKDIDALFAKHKLNLPLNKEPAEIFKNVSLEAFLTDSFAYLKTSVLKKGDSLADALPIPPGKPQNVKVDGDSAQATFGDKPVQFARVNNKWFIRLTN